MNKRVCVIGAGQWGKKHVFALRKIGALSGIVDSNPKIRKELKTQYPDVTFFSDINKALEDKFDGFTIATPPQSHYDIAFPSVF